MYTRTEALNLVEKTVSRYAASVTSARNSLAEAASSRPAEELAGLANSVGKWVHATHMAETVWNALSDENNTVERVMRYAIVEPLLVGADDGWSGRRGDVARSEHDGAREAARDLVRILERVVEA